MTGQEAFPRRYEQLRGWTEERLQKYRRRGAPAEIRDASSYVLDGG
jgi:hypothetical protein